MRKGIEFFERNCPICGKKFYPLPEHAYKRFRNGEWLKFCSWTCFRKDEKDHEIKKEVKNEY